MVESSKPCFFRNISSCCPDNRDTHTVVADLEGSLLREESSFPFFALVAFETGGPLRLLLLLLLTPLAFLLRNLVSESAGVRVLVFASLAGVKLSSINSVARAVLPKFYASEVRADAWRVFSACGRRWVVTAIPRVMVEPFAKGIWAPMWWWGASSGVQRADHGVGGWPGVVAGDVKEAAQEDARRLDGAGDQDWSSEELFSPQCSLQGGLCGVRKAGNRGIRRRRSPPAADRVPRRSSGSKTHPLRALLTVVWFPIGFLLACLRIAAGSLLPMPFVSPVLRLLGVRIIVKGNPPSASSSGVLFVCSHRTLLDPIFLSAALRRPVPALTYSVSRLSELLSPITTIRLSRNRSTDAATIRRLLATGDLAICPEGTTCRASPSFFDSPRCLPSSPTTSSPWRWRTGWNVPWHDGQGWKGWTHSTFFMNPSPAYKVTFLEKLPKALTCGAGRPSYEVANDVQRLIAGILAYECTNLTRRDKYRALAGNDGTVAEKHGLDLGLLAVLLRAVKIISNLTTKVATSWIKSGWRSIEDVSRSQIPVDVRTAGWSMQTSCAGDGGTVLRQYLGRRWLSSEHGVCVGDHRIASVGIFAGDVKVTALRGRRQ
ncbi:hypothetical protein HPP92_020361 [Vanilla planifolia]|uniref:Phospholipid/glycerol acyltransferase domain-containing protein n=1 Tax=Vanilla planifolia TaxID=51239 RepID=A0A835QAK1_VANPL|nr:hypothetical protein HPP92_020361 [Vanilla planifolia]